MDKELFIDIFSNGSLTKSIFVRLFGETMAIFICININNKTVTNRKKNEIKLLVLNEKKINIVHSGLNPKTYFS